MLAWLLSQVVKLALSRSREFLADAGSVELTKNPDAMISALRKIENRGELPGATSAVMELCIDNPREGFADLFATHPSVDSRVKALVKYAGGHDPGPLALPSDTDDGAGGAGRNRAIHRSTAAASPRTARGAMPRAPAGLPAGAGAGPHDGSATRDRHRQDSAFTAVGLTNSPRFCRCSRPRQVEFSLVSAMFAPKAGISGQCRIAPAIGGAIARKGHSMAKPAVIVVGADKGGVGKTTVSRTLARLFQRQQRADPRVRHRIAARHAEALPPGHHRDRRHDDHLGPDEDLRYAEAAIPSVTVIDVRAGLLSPALASLRDIGFLDAAKSGQITFAVFHILGPSIASLDEIAETADFMHGAKYFLVKNFINNTSFFEWDQATYNSYFHRIKDATELTIPKLNEMAYEQVEVSSVPFLKFVANKGPHDEAANYSFVLRGYVRHWLANVWSEFDRIKLTDIVGTDKPAPATAAKNNRSRRGLGWIRRRIRLILRVMRRTPVYIICSPRPLVGKTLVARLLSEFLLLKHGTVDRLRHQSERAVAAGLPAELTETADVNDTFGKMQLMDRLIVNDGVAKVIDLGYHAFDEFFKMTDEIGFVKEAARRGVAPVILFVADTDRASARGYQMLQQQIPAMRWCDRQ